MSREKCAVFDGKLPGLLRGKGAGLETDIEAKD
jgi:hypothetical protein